MAAAKEGDRIKTLQASMMMVLDVDIVTEDDAADAMTLIFFFNSRLDFGFFLLNQIPPLYKYLTYTCPPTNMRLVLIFQT
jgi:hypothetical protein